LAGLVAAPAWAAEITSPTTQARVAHGEFLTQVAAATSSPAVVCVVDSGVSLNADTTASLVGRESIYGGTLDGVDEHGTYMAMHAASPINGFGGVGAWPAAKIYSVRALAQGETIYARSAVYQAIDKCRAAKTNGINVQVILMSLGGDPPLPGSTEQLATSDSVQQVRNVGIDVVAAAETAAARWSTRAANRACSPSPRPTARGRRAHLPRGAARWLSGRRAAASTPTTCRPVNREREPGQASRPPTSPGCSPRYATPRRH